MILNHIKEKIKDLVLKVEEPPVYLAILIILVAFISFGLGRLSLIEERRQGVKINMPAQTQGTASVGAVLDQNQNTVVASKNGTKYYFSWCSGISRISAQNKVVFSSSKEAEQAGYSIAANCTAP
ncbi:MAG: hypothetical protein AAB488_00800 [Patescibacteria group bacterium]